MLFCNARNVVGHKNALEGEQYIGSFRGFENYHVHAIPTNRVY